MHITEMLQRVHQGDQQALQAVIPLVYTELKKLAAGHLRHEGEVRPIETTALVHEAYLRLAGSKHPSYENRSHFFGIASRLMRQILVDFARTRSAQKRSLAPDYASTILQLSAPQPDHTLLMVDDALLRLEKTDKLKAQLIEMRFFGGMTAEESATALALPVQTVRQHLRVAQAWLHKEIRP